MSLKPMFHCGECARFERTYTNEQSEAEELASKLTLEPQMDGRTRKKERSIDAVI